MNQSQQFAQALNTDAQAQALIEKLTDHALETGMSADQYMEARKTIVMLAIARNPILLDELADEVYNQATT